MPIANPTEDLRAKATALDAQTNVDETGLLAREDALAKERQQQLGQLNVKRTAAIDEYDTAGKDLQGAMQQTPEKVPLPNTDLGPPIDPGVFKDFMGGMMALALIGAAGGRSHYMGAMEALDGSLRGFREGNMELVRERKEKFDRDFKEAQAKQSEADKAYAKILDNKKLTLNMKAEQLRIASVQYEDWDMNAKALQHDFDGMHRRIDQNRRRADTMQNLATKLDEQKMFKDMAADAKKAAEGEHVQFDEQDKAFWSKVLEKGGDLPPGLARTKEGRALVQQSMAGVSHSGVKPEDYIANKAEFQGMKAGERTLGTRSAQAEMAVNEAVKMKPILVQASEAFSRTGYQPINKVWNAWEKNTGSVEARQLGAALNTYVNVYARAVNPQGVGTVSDKEHARELLSTADSHEQLVGILSVLDLEMQAAKASPQQTKKDLRSNFTGAAPEGKSVNWNDLP